MQRIVALGGHWGLMLIIILAGFFLTINVAQSWAGAYQDNGLNYSAIAVNDLRYGLVVTKGQSLADSETFYTGSFGIPGVPDTQEFQYLLTGPVHPFFYVDHPPLLSLTIAGAFSIFGLNFWVARLVPILYSLAALILLYLLAHRLFGLGTALCASFLFTTFPMFAYFGQIVDHEAPTLFWVLLLLLGYVQWCEANQRRWLAVMAGAIVIGGWYGWPLYYAAVLLFAVDWLASRHWNGQLFLSTIAPAVFAGVLLLAQVWWAVGSLSPLMTAFLSRATSSAYAVAGPSNPLAWGVVLFHRNMQGYARWSTLLMPLVALFLLLRGRREGWSLRVRVLVVCLLVGLVHIGLFPYGAFFHDYWQYYLLPFYSLSLGWFSHELIGGLIASPRLRALAYATAALGVLAVSWPLIARFYYSSGHLIVLLGLGR